MIVIDLQGGLGNQLFQYAAARYLSIKNKDDNIYFHPLYYAYVKNRRLLLNKFNLVGRVGLLSDYPFLFLATVPVFGKYFSSLYERINSSACQIYKEKKPYLFDQDLQKQQGCLLLKGFWQSKEYAQEIRSILVKELTLKDKLSRAAERYLKTIKKENSVSVHVRRGDYLNNPSFPSCTLDYYLGAVKIISKKVKNPHFFIFSDDLIWVKENFKNLDPVTFVSNVGNEIEEFYLMSNTKHAIIANSTFSWWASWLAKQKNQIVIAPDPWLSAKDKTEEMYLDSWIRFQK